MVQYLSLEEAAQKLGISPDKLKEMAERNEIRPFRDRGNMRFRSQEIEELGRRLGRGSDPELPIVDLPPRTPQPQAKNKSQDQGEVFDFALGGDESESVEIGQEPVSGGSKSKGSKSGRTPATKPGSDSDVRLVADGSDLDFQVAEDSRIRLEEAGPGSKSGSGRGRKEKKSGSDVRIVPPEVQSDSDVKIVESSHDSNIVIGREGTKKASDSDIRLEPEKAAARKRGDDLVTEEIDLDAELRAGESSMQAPGKSGKGKIKAKGKGESDGGKSTKKDSSSDFELTPGGQDQSPLELADEEVQLGELTDKAGGSGINLQDPADSGISLEQGGSSEDALEFELKDDSSGPKTPPRKVALEDDSDSEFELSLDPGESASKKKKTKAKPKADVDSDSEFELTLDDSGDLLPVEEGAAAKSGEGEADIFETDFEVPALDEDSGSQAVALDDSDTDVESSDFDLALGEEDIASEEESGSQVVALEEEEAEAGASTVARAGRRRPGLLEEEEGALGEEELETEAAPEERVVAAAPATWGPLPAIIMIPCVIVMFLVTLISFEQIQSMWGYHNNQMVSGSLSRSLAKLFLLDVKD